MAVLEIMAWCEANGIDYVFGLPGNAVLHADAMIVAAADACATDRALRGLVELRRYAETRYAAKSWGADTRRVVARVEASSLGLDIRFVVTSLKDEDARHDLPLEKEDGTTPAPRWAWTIAEMAERAVTSRSVIGSHERMAGVGSRIAAANDRMWVFLAYRCS